MRACCPECGGDAELFAVVIFTNREVRSRDTDWKLRCACGYELEGDLPVVSKLLCILLYLAPIAACWGVFLAYAGVVRPDWLRFGVWLLHVGPGMLAGDWLCDLYVRRSVERYL